MAVSSSNDPQPPAYAVYDVTKINDGLLEDWFWDQQPNDVHFVGPWAGDPGWVQIALPSVQTIDHVVVYSAEPWQWMGTLLDYELQYDAGGGNWVTVDHVQEPTNTFPVFSPDVRSSVDSYFSDRCIFVHHFKPVTTSGIRLLVHNVTYGAGATLDAFNASGQDGGQGINLREVEIYNDPSDTLFKPVAPMSLAATGGKGQVQLLWSPSTGASSYTVKRALTSGGPYATVAASITATSYTDTSVTNGLTYYYVVTAAGTGGESLPSNEASATPTGPAPVPPPPRPCGSTAGAGRTPTPLGNAWQADADFTGGATWNYQGLAVTGTPDPSPLPRRALQRRPPSATVSPATPGAYTLKLHFVEGDNNVKAGSRLFNVLVNGTPVLTNFDVFATGGGTGKACRREPPCHRPDGQQCCDRYLPGRRQQRLHRHGLRTRTRPRPAGGPGGPDGHGRERTGVPGLAAGRWVPRATASTGAPAPAARPPSRSPLD